MTEHPLPDSEAEAPAGLVVAEQWADFTKAYSFYPEANTRVREALEDMVQSIRRACSHGLHNGSQVSVYFLAQKVVIDEQPVQPRPGSNLGWLAERVNRSALAGVAFSAQVEAETVLEFTRRLLEHYTRPNLDASFEGLWPDPFEGMQLVPRQLDRTADRSYAPEGDVERTWGGGGSLAAGTSTVGRAVHALAEDSEVREVLRFIQERTGGEEPQEGKAGAIDLLVRLVRLMPFDALQDAETTRRVALQALRTMADGLGESRAGGGGQALDGERELSCLLFVLSRKMFSRGDETKAEREAAALSHDRAEPPTAASALDGGIHEDLDALVAEHGTLPQAPVNGESMESLAEELGVYLYYLVRPQEEADRVKRFHPALSRLLRQPDDEALGVLGSYLKARRESAREGSDGPRYDRILDFLRDTDRLALVRSSDAINEEYVREAFPRDFLLYLDALDPQAPADRAELGRVLEAVGVERLLGASSILTREGGLLSSDRVNRLLSTPGEEVLPLVLLILRAGGRTWVREVMAFLQRLKPSAREASLLWVHDDPGGLPSDYLGRLIESLITGHCPAALKDQTARLICEFVREAAHRPRARARRLYAVKMLASFKCREARVLLEHLVGARRFWFFPREPKAIRQAAAEVLRSYGLDEGAQRHVRAAR